MIKIGDKVKFDKYLPYNYMNNTSLIKKLSNKKNKITKQQIYTERVGNISRYKSILINDNIQEGIFVGTFRKKLIRSYYRTEPTALDTSNLLMNDVDFEEILAPSEFSTSMRLRRVMRQPIIRPVDWNVHTNTIAIVNKTRYSNNPRRVDDPRSLDKIAMLKVGRRLIGVPMVNIYKCNFDNIFKVI